MSNEQLPGAEAGIEYPGIDPREITKAEWCLVKEALVEKAKRLQWRASKPGLSEGERVMLQEAAERRFRAGQLATRARAWKRTAEKEEGEQGT